MTCKNRSHVGQVAFGWYSVGQCLVIRSSRRCSRSVPVFNSSVPFGQLSSHGSRSKSSGRTGTPGSLRARSIMAFIRGAASDLRHQLMTVLTRDRSFSSSDFAFNGSLLQLAGDVVDLVGSPTK